jgi:3-methyladenine DNA glycosylase/8-oxoguanine DNA glycosylase
MRNRGGVLHRLLHFRDCPVVVRVAQPSPDRVLFGARSVDPGGAEWGIERMRAALGIDLDMRPFHDRFRSDPLIGAALRADPTLRVGGRPEPFEALVLAVCEQLIEYERAAAIQRRIVARLGRRCPESRLRDSPAAAVVAAEAPALLASLGLSEGRALALVRCAREVASGRVDLFDPEPEAGWRRLLAIPGIGSWTVQTLALTGQGRLDQLPAGDLKYLKLVGRMRTGNPRARATEQDVIDTFAPYGEWAGLAGAYALRAGMSRGALRLAA